jgi:hypothetical protein
LALEIGDEFVENTAPVKALASLPVDEAEKTLVAQVKDTRARQGRQMNVGKMRQREHGNRSFTM